MRTAPKHRKIEQYTKRRRAKQIKGGERILNRRTMKHVVHTQEKPHSKIQHKGEEEKKNSQKPRTEEEEKGALNDNGTSQQGIKSDEKIRRR